ncbi:MAG: hypothetical protein ACI8PT_003385, partial [Gammaproteobacteria bacterium]
ACIAHADKDKLTADVKPTIRQNAQRAAQDKVAGQHRSS